MITSAMIIAAAKLEALDTVRFLRYTKSTEAQYRDNPDEAFTTLWGALHRVAKDRLVSRELAKEVYDLWCATFPKANLDTPAAWSAWKRSVDEHNAKVKL